MGIKDFKGQDLPLVFTKSKVVVENDTKLLEPGLLYIGVGGDLKVKLENDSDFTTYKNIADGTIFTGSVIMVHTDTTCTDILQLFA